MKHLRIWLIGAMAALPLALLLAVALAVQTTPQVPARPDVALADVERAMALMERHDPRRLRAGDVQTVSLAQDDIGLLLGHGLRRWVEAPAVRVRLQPYTAAVLASLSLPDVRLLPRLWLNIDLRLREGEPLPQVERLRIGRLPLPPWAAEAVLRRLAESRGLRADPGMAREFVRRISLTQGLATITYVYPDNARERVLASVVTAAEQARLKAYSDHYAALSRDAGADRQVSLVALLPPMFALAQSRSAGLSDDAAAAENRAALLVLTLHTLGRNLSSLVPAARDWDRARWLAVMLQGRSDFPKHFLVSAVLAAEGSSPLADAVGLYKEVADARNGSGFSFNDIAADRAGTRLGERAVQSPFELQAALAALRDERELMPDVRDLPEFLPEPEFQRRFGGVDGPGYRQMLADIDARIAATPLLR